MPLTPAHAAAAPLLRRLLRPLGLTLPLSALVIGTLTPDFQYLIRLNPGGGTWHSLAGLVEYCLPAGLAVWWLFKLLIGPALIRLLPPGLAASAAAQVTPGPTIRLVPGAALAVLMGAASHDLWDSFTHESRWGVREFPSLGTWVSIGSDSAPLYVVLQLASSVFGLAVVGWIIWRWVASHPATARAFDAADRRRQTLEAGVLLLAALAGAVLNAAREPRAGVINIGLAAVGAMSALAVALLIYGLIDKARGGAR